MLIQIASSSESNNGDILPDDELNRILVNAQARLFPHLRWMRNLKRLIILRRDDSTEFYHPQDAFMSELLFWLLEDQERPVHSLERFWINDNLLLEDYYENIMIGPSVKSLALIETEGLVFELNAERFRHLEHVAGLVVRRLDHLPDLKYFRGECTFDIEVNI